MQKLINKDWIFLSPILRDRREAFLRIIEEGERANYASYRENWDRYETSLCYVIANISDAIAGHKHICKTCGEEFHETYEDWD